MESLGYLAQGFEAALSPSNLFYCVIGVLWGTVVGVLPGLGPLAGLALLLPLTFQLDAQAAIIMLAGIFYGAMYGGSTTSILVRIPGEAASVITCIDGHEMAKKGRAGPALVIAALGSWFGGTVSVIGLMLFAPPLAELMLTVGPSATFSLMVLALIVMSFVSAGSTLKTFMMIVVGLILGTVGLDGLTAHPRFTFGSLHFVDGISFVAMALGLFGVSEILINLENVASIRPMRPTLRSLVPTAKDLRGFGARDRTRHHHRIPDGDRSRDLACRVHLRLVRGREETLQGAGGFRDREDRRRGGAGDGEQRDHGKRDDPASRARHSRDSGDRHPLSALMIHGIEPGPQLINDHPDVFWGLIASMYIGNVILVILNVPLVGVFVSLLRTPYAYLGPMILLVSIVGVYTVNASSMEIWLMTIFGAIGYVLRKLGFDVAPLLLAVVLGDRMELAFRRSLTILNGDFSIFVDSATSKVLLGAVIVGSRCRGSPGSWDGAAGRSAPTIDHLNLDRPRHRPSIGETQHVLRRGSARAREERDWIGGGRDGAYGGAHRLLVDHEGHHGSVERLLRPQREDDRPGAQPSPSSRLDPRCNAGGDREVRQRHPRPGDVVVLNDPYEAGGMHLPDIFMFVPVFVDDYLLGYAVLVGHYNDVGGRVPGSSAADSTEIYQEGLRIPVLKLYERGRANETLLDLIRINVRIPDVVLGDLQAQLAACRIGERGVSELARRYGIQGIERHFEELLAYSERAARQTIRSIPDGVYRYTDFLDDDGVHPDRPVPIRVAVEVRGRRGDVRLRGKLAAGRGRNQLHALVREVGRVLRAAVGDVLGRAEQRGILPPDHGEGGARLDPQPTISGRMRGPRRDRFPGHRRDHRCARGGGSRANSRPGRRGDDQLQHLRIRRRGDVQHVPGSGDGQLGRRRPPRRARRRRQPGGEHRERAVRGRREAGAASHRALRACSRQRRRGAVARRARGDAPVSLPR